MAWQDFMSDSWEKFPFPVTVEYSRDVSICHYMYRNVSEMREK
jgi:hypothetical protein